MITRQNVKEVVNQLSDKDKKRLTNTCKEYGVIELHIFNTGSFTTLKLTDDLNRYKNVSDHGNAIIEVQELNNLIEPLNLDLCRGA